MTTRKELRAKYVRAAHVADQLLEANCVGCNKFPNKKTRGMGQSAKNPICAVCPITKKFNSLAVHMDRLLTERRSLRNPISSNIFDGR